MSDLLNFMSCFGELVVATCQWYQKQGSDRAYGYEAALFFKNIPNR